VGLQVLGAELRENAGQQQRKGKGRSFLLLLALVSAKVGATLHVGVLFGSVAQINDEKM
jgi:hypothetical protein